MKRFVRVLFLILAISIVALSFGCPTTTTTPTATTGQTTAASPTAPAAVITLTYCSTSLPTSHPAYETANWKAKRIPEACGGRIKLNFYPTASLFENTEMVNALVTGATDFADLGPVYIMPVMPALIPTSNCMLFENQSHAYALWDSEIGDELYAKLEKERGIVVVAKTRDTSSAQPWGNSPIFNSVRPITKLEDMKGLKLRVPPNKLLTDAMAALGVSVFSIPVGDVPTALQQHMVDGLLTSWGFVPTFTLQNVTKYAVDVTIDTPGSGGGFCANLKSWNTVPPDLQKIIHDVVYIEMYQVFDIPKLSNAATEAAIAMYKGDPSTKTTVLSPEETERWRSIIRPLWQASIDSLPASEKDLGRRILAKIEELRPQFVKK